MDSQPIVFNLKNNLIQYTLSELERMQTAGEIVQQNLRLLTKSGQNMVGQCLANQGTFFEEEHFPKGDVYDSDSHAQYYYHAHRPESGEHGHFHTFLRSAGMKSSWRASPYKGKAKRPTGKNALSHIVAISMDGPGKPIGMFSTNRWVTDETFYPADTVVEMINRFSIEQSYPCLATNRAISALMKLFVPQIRALLLQRDKTIEAWVALYPNKDVYEDRDLEITSMVDINVDKQISAIRKAMRSAA